MKYLVCIWLAAFIVLSASGGNASPTVVSSEAVEKDTVWSGEVTVERQLKVARGAKLTVKPGAVVRFAGGAGLVVEGALVARGTKDGPVSFTSAAKEPKPGDWTGINLNSCSDGSALEHCRISYAGSVTMAACSPRVAWCEITKGVQGLVLARKSAPEVTGCRISGMTEGGIQCQMGSAPRIEGNTVEDCGPYGIASGQDAQPVISKNTITGCVNGITLSQAIPPVEGNTLRKNKTGILASSVGKALVIRGNRVAQNDVGIVCQQFSSPVIEKNTVTGNKQGIVVFRSSDPWIKNNEVSENGEGILAVQICRPKITGNRVHGNGKGIFLELSSYAAINGNNIHDNKVQLELGEMMSNDWEDKVRQKPVRGSQAQNLSMANRGRAVRQDVPDSAQLMGYVDATGNWWGEAPTREMEAKGPDADIAGFKDYHDVPTRQYEGYPDSYVQDRIKYEGWKKAAIKEAGI